MCVAGVQGGPHWGKASEPSPGGVKEQAVGTSGDRRSRQRAELGKGVGQV